MDQMQERAISSPTGTDRDGRTLLLVRILRGEEAETGFLSQDVAARELGGTGGEAEVPALTEALATNDCWLVRQEAAWALGRIQVGGNLVLPALLKALASDKDNVVRCAAARAIGWIEVDAELVVPGLVNALRRDENLDVVCVSIEVLGQIGSVDAVPALCEYLSSDSRANLPDWGIEIARLGAVKAVQKIDPVLALQALAETLMRPDEWRNVREAALKAVMGIGRAALPALIHVLATDQFGDNRSVAAVELGRIGLDALAAVPALTEATADENDRVRREATASLVKITALAKNAKASLPPHDHHLRKDNEFAPSFNAKVDGTYFKIELADTLQILTRWRSLVEILLHWPAGKPPSVVAITLELNSRGIDVARPTVSNYIKELEDRLSGRLLLVASQRSGRASEFAEGAMSALEAARDALNAYVRRDTR